MQVMRLRLSTETYIWWLGDPTSMSLVISPQKPIHSWCFVQFSMDFACNPFSSWSIRISSFGGAVFDVPIATCGSHVDEIHNLNEPVLVLYHFYIFLPWTRDHMGKSSVIWVLHGFLWISENCFEAPKVLQHLWPCRSGRLPSGHLAYSWGLPRLPLDFRFKCFFIIYHMYIQYIYILVIVYMYNSLRTCEFFKIWLVWNSWWLICWWSIMFCHAFRTSWWVSWCLGHGSFQDVASILDPSSLAPRRTSQWHCPRGWCQNGWFIIIIIIRT